MADAPIDLVCLSHLWWTWVWQRPQHLMSRLAQQREVVWVEEPRIEIGPPADEFVVTQERPHIRVARYVLSSDAATFRQRFREMLVRTGVQSLEVPPDMREASWLFTSPAQEQLERHAVEYVASRRRRPLVVWVYTPLVLSLVEQLQPDLVVYDVMDELSAFKFAPAQLPQLEHALLERADLVFTGGPSLFEARRERHPDVHLFASGVEQQHFAQALSSDLAIPQAVRDLPHPMIGFFGVIDERIDLALLRRAAELRPDWSWVMVGPVIKIEQHELPSAPNIHYLGMQAYADLPAYLKAFDVAMLPFALNEATRFISPTKTLEYMAAHKPIVSTPIADVVSLYGSVVRKAETPEQLVAAAEQALGEGTQARTERAERENHLLAEHAWDRIANKMQELIDDRLRRKGA